MKICTHGCTYIHIVFCGRINQKENRSENASEVHKEIKIFPYTATLLWWETYLGINMLEAF